MKKILKTLVLSLLTAALLCCTIPCAFAADSTTEKEPEIYTIDLDAMGGSSSVVALSTGLNGRLTALPEQPTLEGYTFDGWYTEPVGGSKISTSTVFTGNTIVYAHWTVKNASTATAPSAPATPVESPKILDHLGVVAVVGALLGTIALATAL